MKKHSKLAFLIALTVMTSGCTMQTYEDFEIPQQGESTLSPVGSYYIENNYDGIPATKEETELSYTTPDGICTIEKKESYYDVTLNYDGNDYYDVGIAYGTAILEIFPDYSKIMEPYIYENISYAFPDINGDYSGIQKRSDTLKASLSDDYIKEMEGIASVIGKNSQGFKKDGILSPEEIYIAQMVPDALRPTACSSITVNGNRTTTGERITSRIMEWGLGSDKQILSAHCVLHSENGDKSYTSITTLGLMDVITGINNDGVMIACHDVGSAHNVPYTCENKTPQSYAARYCLENYSSAKDAGDYLVENALNYTFSTNYLLTDKNDAFCAEIAVDPLDGTPILRDSSTELHSGLSWDDENLLCIVNSFAAKGNSDIITNNSSNLVRWEKYRRIFCTDEILSFSRFKELITCEKMTDMVINFRSSEVVHLVVVDYSTGNIEIIFPHDEDMVDTPEFLDAGKY